MKVIGYLQHVPGSDFRCPEVRINGFAPSSTDGSGSRHCFRTPTLSLVSSLWASEKEGYFSAAR
jgi:hypothetical protein